MKSSTLLVMLVACGGDKVHHLTDAPPGIDAAKTSDASIDGPPDGPPDANQCGGDCCTADQCPSTQYVCTDTHQCVDVTGSLTGLVWKLPCGADAGPVSCTTDPNATVTTTLGGTAGVTYDVTVHLRGIVEQKTYAGGCANGFWLSGGATNGDTYNVYKLAISAPPQTYFLNQGVSNHQYVDVLDYTQTFRADAGATVTLYADAVDSAEIKNLSMADGTTPVVVAGVPAALVAQPYDGQFIAMEVTSVVPDPIASASTGTSGTAGNALLFGGTQQVTVADSATIDQATQLTVEAWATFDNNVGSYNSIFGKPLGNASTDSFTLWHQGGQLNAGVGVDSTSGTANVPIAVAAGTWHHYAMAYDNASTVTSLYVDGQLVSCATGRPAPTYDTHPFLIGADIDNTATNGWWWGAIDEVRLWSTARTGAQVWADMHAHQLGATTGLAGEWTFDEGAGQTTADSSGNGNSGVIGTNTNVEASDPMWITSTVPH